MERNSRQLLRKLLSGDHPILQHPGFAHSIVVPHPKKDLPIGLVRKIYKDAGWLP